jgi:SM-20-related protein
MVDVLQIPGFVGPEACAALRAELRAAAGGPAPLRGRDGGDGPVRPQVRKVTRLSVPAATGAHMAARFTAVRPALEARFALALGACEPPQFLRYQAGDFFVAHQDGNTPLVHDDSRFRRISLVLFLADQSDAPSAETFGGGTLLLHDTRSYPPLRLPVTPRAGTLVAFRAETTHEVTPVTHGERFTIVTWLRAP